MGRFISEDGLRLSQALSLYAYVRSNAPSAVDPLGLFDVEYRALQTLEMLAIFGSGFFDSMSIGLSGSLREGVAAILGLGSATVIAECSGLYRAGMYSEVGAELAMSGLSFTLKSLAKQVAHKQVRRQANQLARKLHPAISSNQTRAHLNPLFGHPGNRNLTLFPTGGLPAAWHTNGWNVRVLTVSAHEAQHLALQSVEEFAKVAFNPGMTAARAVRNSAQMTYRCGCR